MLKFSPIRLFFIMILATASLLVSFPNAAQARFELSKNYESLTGREKQKILWSQTLDTKYQGELPPLAKFDFKTLLKLTAQAIIKKKKCMEDVAPKDWEKYLHKRGALAKVKIVPLKGSGGSGVFSGSPYALLRLSLTFRPDNKKRDVAPGLALKVLRDGVVSGNVSALYALNGQGKDYNFFKHPLSNIVPRGSGFGANWIHETFKLVTDYPEQLPIKDLASVNAQGKRTKTPHPYKQIFFVPNPDLKQASEPHDFRQDLLKIPVGTKLFTIRGLAQQDKNDSYSGYKDSQIQSFADSAVPIAEIFSTSEFVASSFGDTGIFFRHEMRSKTDTSHQTGN